MNFAGRLVEPNLKLSIKFEKEGMTSDEIWRTHMQICDERIWALDHWNGMMSYIPLKAKRLAVPRPLHMQRATPHWKLWMTWQGPPLFVLFLWGSSILPVGGFNPSEKYESQLVLLFPRYGKITNVPNHPRGFFLWLLGSCVTRCNCGLVLASLNWNNIWENTCDITCR